MKVRYTEGPAAVVVDGVGEVERGKSVDVTGDLAKQLLEQGWEKASSGRKGRKGSSGRKKSSSTRDSSPPETAGATQPPAPPANPDNPAGE